MRIVLLGPPGCGKGTQAARISKRWGIPHISTGNILRDGVRRGSELGLKAKDYMGRGALVPDEIMLGLVIGRLKEEDAQRGFVLDGFPRTVPQARGLFSFLKGIGRSLEFVIYLEGNPENLVGRLSVRRWCPKCGAVYNLITNPPQKEGVCDLCGSEFIVRDDDREETVRERLKVFEEETEPLRDFYRSRGLLFIVDANGGVEDVYQRMEGILKREVQADG